MRMPSRAKARLSRRHLLAAGAGLAASAFAATSQAQTFPQNRPITLVVPFPAGGGTDIIARNLAERLRERLGAAIVVENRGGGGGTIAAQAVMRAAADGHTLFLVTSTFVTAAAITPDLPYDIVRDFTPIAMLGRGPMVVVVGNNLGITSIPQLIERLRAQPETLNFVSSGLGSVTHLAGELFMQRTGTRMVHIPYRGGAPAVTDLLAGHGHVFFSTVPTILGQIRGNTVRLIAVTGRTRSALFPDTPTVMEAGVRDYDVGTWWGIVSPRGLPESIRTTLNGIINEASASPAIQRQFHDEGAESFRGTPAEFANALEAELTSWRNVVREGGLRVQ